MRKKGPEREEAARIVELRDIFRPFWTTGDDVGLMWDSIVPVTRDDAGTSVAPCCQGGGIPATRIVTIPPKIDACPMCNAKTDGSGNGEPREPRVVFHTSPFWVQKVRRVCGACHHRFATSDGDVEQYLLKVHKIPAFRRFRNADARRGQTWITFHMAMKAIASFMLTKNLHAVRRDFSRNIYEALWEQAIAAGANMTPIREYIPRTLSSIPSRQYFRTFLQRFFAGLTDSAVSRMQEMTMAVEGGIIKVDGNYKISKKVCGERGSKAAFQKRLRTGECVILALGAKGGLLAPPASCTPRSPRSVSPSSLPRSCNA